MMHFPLQTQKKKWNGKGKKGKSKDIERGIWKLLANYLHNVLESYN